MDDNWVLNDVVIAREKQVTKFQKLILLSTKLNLCKV